MKFVLPIALIGILVCANFASADDTSRPIEFTYRALRVSGSVLTRTPTSVKWVPVKVGVKMQEGQILQVSNGASVTLEEQSTGKAVGLAKDKVQITITKPMVARLSRDLLRKMKLSAFFIDRAVAPLPAENQKEVPLTLRDAWDRLAAIITSIPPPEAPVDELSEMEREGMTFGVSAKRLQLVSPAANAVVQSGEWPTEVKLVWLKPPKTSLSYLVYVWRADLPRGSAIAMTKQDGYTAKLKQPGSYFVQVTSIDGAWQSIALPIHAIAPLEGVVASTSGSRRMPLAITEALTAKYPTEGLLTTESSNLLFSWSLAVAWPNPSFEVRIFDSRGNVVKSLAVSTDTLSVELAPGAYKWNVSLVGTQFKSGDSKFQVLEADALKSHSKRRKMLQKLISSGRDATVSFDESF